jgi:hypothetical protein
MQTPLPASVTQPMAQSGGGCGCMAWKGGLRGKDRSTRRVRRGGYTATARNRKYLRRWKQGKSIGYTMRSSLKAKGLIPRASGKKIVSPKYK